ncbi:MULTISPECIES: circadian clock KaiB family protein [unclassified Methylobacterium]|uniref:circadian clock KaiB family protein n=1 Tax=unclassified Methylobacterium TaxID=2615210 RepID=UPI001FB8D36C|nr:MULTISPECIES: circadian clock KaiB family protein [unclassified Methylobacterium]MCJ2092073.1 circadian clock KaiB family protein [Methylobacterium sp. J-072]MCJ2139751.1 circadian clock KaiB family protein [Methylobacterium sp. E-066]
MSGGGANAPDPAEYQLRLFIAGTSPRSQRTIENLRRICREHLADRHSLVIVDIYQQPELAEAAQVVAAPTLLKLTPEPLRRIVGDLSDEARVLRGLGVYPLPRGGDGSSI